MKTFLRKCLVLIAMLAPLCGVSAQETTVTFTCGVDGDGSTTNTAAARTMTKEDVTISFTSAVLSTANADGYRIYSKKPFTIKHDKSAKITKVELIDFTFDKSTYTKPSGMQVTEGGGSYVPDDMNNSGVWTGNAESVTINNTGNAQARIITIKVTYTSGPQKDETSITFADDENKNYTQGENGGTVTFANPATLTPSEAGNITYSSDKPEIATVDTEGNVTVNTNNIGTATITASFAETDTYAGSSTSYTITVTKALTSVAFADGTNRTYTQGENNGTITFTDVATLTPSNAGSLTYTSDKPEIADVDENGQVTVNTNNIGTATITASFAETDTHEASSASYTITVEKAVISGAENYVKIDSNDDLTGKYVVIGHVTTQNTDYILTKITGNNKYYNAINLTLNGDQICEIPEEAEGYAVFSFEEKDKTYAFKNTTTGNYTKIGGGSSNNTVSEVADATTSGTHATITFDDVKGNQTVKFDASGTKVYLQFNPNQTPRFSSYDNQNPIQLFRHGYSRDVTNGNFGTLCLPYGGTISGATLYAIEGKQMENGEVKSISLVEVKNVEAGKPYIFQAAAEKLVVYYEGDIQATTGNDNGLLGSYNDTAVEAGKYVISNNTVKKCGEGSKIGKNRCYIDMDNVPEKTASAAALIINFNDSTDAIESIEANADSRNAIYDLSGRRVKTAQKGLYIVNGKKIIK